MNNDLQSRPAEATPPPPASATPWCPQLTEHPSQKPIPTLRDSVFACLFLVFGYLMICAFPASRHALGGALILILLFALGGLYLRLCGARASLPNTVPALVGALLAVSLITNGNATLRNTAFFFVTLLFFYWIYLLCDPAGKVPNDGELPSQVLRAWFKLPWSHLGAWLAAVGSLGKRSDSGRRFWKTLGWVVIGLLCATVPTLVIGLLLSYDSQFTALLKDLFSFSFDGFGEFLLKAIFALPTAILLFGSVFAAKQRRESPATEGEAPISFDSLHVLPRPLLCAAATPVLALYVLFFISQWDYYVSAFTHVLPEGLTYATYARDGFFQLCTVCLINAVLLWIFFTMARKTEKGTHPVQRVYAGVTSVFTLILIATALSKMFLYIDTYGLTQKRVYASWGMVLLAVVFVAVLLRQIFRRFPATVTVLFAGILLFALITLPNVDGMIASYNVDRFLAGDLDTVDVEALEKLDVSAVPALVKLEKELTDRAPLGTLNDEERATLAKAGGALNAIAIDLNLKAERQNGVERLFSFSIPTARARALLEEREARR